MRERKKRERDIERQKREREGKRKMERVREGGIKRKTECDRFMCANC